MRTKTLLAAAAISAAFAVNASAQTVYSVNAVGYVNVTVPANGFALLANPLNQPTNTLNAVLPDLPVNTVVYLWQGTQFSQGFKKTASAAGWLPPTAGTNIINPGQGFFIQNTNSTPTTITFVGEVPQGDLSVVYPAGFSLVGSQVPQAGKVETDLKLPAKSGDKVFVYVNGNYAQGQKLPSGIWGGGEPTVGVGQGFWLQSVAAGNWTRTFSVNSQ